jgi:TatA/E family protein of Tat protein translocase
MPQIGPLEIAVVLLVALLVFGPSKLPEVGKQAARGLREFRQFQANVRDDLKGMLDADDERTDTAAADDDDFVPPDPPEDPPALEAGPVAAGETTDDTRRPGETPPADAAS